MKIFTGMKTYINPPREKWEGILARPQTEDSDARARVLDLIAQVRNGGDEALFRLTRELDGIEIRELQVSQGEIKAAARAVPRELKNAVATARANLEKFHSAHKTEDCLLVTTPGVRCWTRTIPIGRVGLYIPGGSAPLFSSVLMLGVPARLAGCDEILLCTPPGPDGSIHPSILYCADLLGIDRIFRVGGAQAVAAMAYGTGSMPRVDKIFGPGNRYVTMAKQVVSLDRVAIDLPAGPSELAVIADGTADPVFIAADLISQAEHGPDSQVLLVCPDEGLIEPVQQELARQLADLPRKETAEQSLENSRIVVLKKQGDILDFINAYAPEHLVIMCRDYGEVGIRIRNAGSVFMGSLSPESAGDYASGTNHTLPTGGHARAYSGLGVSDFVKRISFQEISAEGLRNLGPSVMCMASEEKLEGHRRAVEVRLSKIKDKLA